MTAFDQSGLQSPEVAHRVISLPGSIWSLSGHSGHWASSTNRARFMAAA
jgi:hypothetical protein